MLVGLRL